MDGTPRLKLPMLAPGQSQKELFHNESLAIVDLLIGGTIEPILGGAPPAAAISGSFYRVGSGATGPWAEHDGELAALDENGWRFCTPFPGLRLTERVSGLEWRFDGEAWETGKARVASVVVGGKQVIGGRTASIAAPSAGSVIDAEARACIGLILGALRGHGLIET